jgi:phage-related protein
VRLERKQHSVHHYLHNHVLKLGFGTSTRKIGGSQYVSRNKWRRPGQFVGLLKVCRQIHAEANALVFASNDFYGNVDSVVVALRTILPLADARNVENVNITLGQEDYSFYDGGLTWVLGDAFTNLVRLLKVIGGLRRVNITSPFPERWNGHVSEQWIATQLDKHVRRELWDRPLSQEVVFRVTKEWTV